MKQIRAIIAATIITAIVGLGMLVVGANAIFNTNTVPMSNAPSDPPAAVSSAAGAGPQAQAEISQLQNLVRQYQNRDQQYQSQINQYQSQVGQLNSEVQQLQNVLVQLQQRGIIRIQSDGTIQLGRGGFSDNGF